MLASVIVCTCGAAQVVGTIAINRLLILHAWNTEMPSLSMLTL